MFPSSNCEENEEPMEPSPILTQSPTTMLVIVQNKKASDRLYLFVRYYKKEWQLDTPLK